MARRLVLCVVAAFVSWNGLAAATVKISNMRTLEVGAWEMQTAVVPPKQKAQCPAGRLIALADSTHLNVDLTNPPAGLFRHHDLGAATPVLGSSTLPSIPDGANYGLFTNDHDFLATPDGDVYFFAGAFSKAAVEQQPNWWKHAYRGAFGPGARSVVLVWRSTDCGNTFELVAEFDPMLFVGGLCANPQEPVTTVNGETRFNAGGSDGNLTRYSRIGDQFYLTFSCVGRLVTTADPPTLGSRVDRTVLAVWKDTGAPPPPNAAERRKGWKLVSTMGSPLWRLGIVLPVAGTIVVGTGEGHLPVFHPNAQLGVWRTTPSAQWARPPSLNGAGGFVGWAGLALPELAQLIEANAHGHTIVARAPGGRVLMTMPDEIGTAFGYRTFAFDPVAKKTMELASNLPVGPSPLNVAMHLTALDAGWNTPVLFYWADVDMVNKSVRIRGRFHYSDTSYSQELEIRRVGGAPAPNAIEGLLGIGDYWGAGGFTITEGGFTRNVYYPAWIDDNGVAAYARIEISNEPGGILLQTINPAPNWKPAVSVNAPAVAEKAAEQLRAYSRRKRER